MDTDALREKLRNETYKNLKKYKIITTHKLVMLYLYNKQNAGMHYTKVREAISISAPMLSQIVLDLTEAGLIESQTPLRDKRQKRLYMTTEGNAEAEKMWEFLQHLVTNR